MNLIFDPNNPFPLVTYGDCSYQHAQEHAVQVDAWLGFQTEVIEENLLDSKAYDSRSCASHDCNDQATCNDQALSTDSPAHTPAQQMPVQWWRGLPVQALQTPYTEIRWILSLLDLQKNQTVVDLGCAYGRMAFVLGHHHPEINFVGYELVAERAHEGQRILQSFKYSRCSILTQDLSAEDFRLCEADYYFIFDFGSPRAIERTLNDLRLLARTRSIRVIARGRYTRHCIYKSHPWLSAINEPRVFETFTIFQS